MQWGEEMQVTRGWRGRARGAECEYVVLGVVVGSWECVCCCMEDKEDVAEQATRLARALQQLHTRRCMEMRQPHPLQGSTP
jgi:hypothetical protein